MRLETNYGKGKILITHEGELSSVGSWGWGWGNFPMDGGERRWVVFSRAAD